MNASQPDSTIGDSARRRIAIRILPLVFAMYIVNYLDRANVAFAKIPMSEQLGFSEGVYGTGAGISVGHLGGARGRSVQRHPEHYLSHGQ